MGSTRKNNSNLKTCKKRFCEGPWAKDQAALFKKVAGAFKVKLPKSKMTGLDKESQKACVTAYCNPTCEGTIFQDGKEFPEALAKQYKGKKFVLDALKKTRKLFFGKKTKVTKNGFYEKMKATRRKKIQSQGALSGCSLM